MRKIVVFLIAFMWATPSLATTAIKDEAQFRSLMDGKRLTIFLYGLSLNVLDNGTITGRALGRDVTGDWAWDDGYFCHTMYWGEREIPYNCQLVEWDGGSTVTFTTERGAGDSAAFGLRNR